MLQTILTMSWWYRRWVEVMCLFNKIRIRKVVSCSPAPEYMLPLIGRYNASRDLALVQAIVYMQMYNEPMPQVPVAVQALATNAVEVRLPETFAGSEVVVK